MHFLGGYLLYQHQYALDVLSKEGMLQTKLFLNPLLPMFTQTTKHQDPFSNDNFYFMLVDSLQYITITHLNTRFVVNQLSQLCTTLLIFNL